MTTLITSITLLFSCQFFPAQPKTCAFNKTLLFEDAVIEAYILCCDTAGVDQSDWLHFVVKNKSSNSVFIKNAAYSINYERNDPKTGTYIQYGIFGKGNKHNLFHHVNDHYDNLEGFELLPNSELACKEFISNYAGVLIEPQQKSGKICPLFQADINYVVDGKARILENKGAQFCFYWNPVSKIPIERLVNRLKIAMQDLQFQRAYSYTVGFLMDIQAVKDRIPTDDFITAVLKRGNSFPSDENIIFLNELKLRNAIPDPRLTDKYSACIAAGPCFQKSELIYYWDNSLLNDLLNSQFLNPEELGRIFEANVDSWFDVPGMKAHIYEGLSKRSSFDNTAIPNAENFENWVKKVKLMSISRDTAIIYYLLPFLEDESAYGVVSLDKYKYMGVLPENAAPDTLKTRVCDVAFVSLLRAIGQTEYVLNVGHGMKYFELIFKDEIIGSTRPLSSLNFDVKPLDYSLDSAERVVTLTLESKARIKAYIAAMK